LILEGNTKTLRRVLRSVNKNFYDELVQVKEWANKNKLVATYANLFTIKTVDHQFYRDLLDRDNQRSDKLAKYFCSLYFSIQQSPMLKLHNCVKKVMKSNHLIPSIIEEEFRNSHLTSGEDSPETTSLIKLLRRKKEQEAEKLEAKMNKKGTNNFSRFVSCFKL
jgi:hypothetical protein